MIGYSLIYGPGVTTNQISWLEFQQTMLDQHDVAKIVIVNKEIAQIYIKPERLTEPKDNEFTKGNVTNKLGPHYIMQIGSVEILVLVSMAHYITF